MAPPHTGAHGSAIMTRSAIWAYPIFFCSGLAGLGYQIVWTRMFAVGLGHEMPSLLAVVAAFFGGLSLGAWGLDRVVSSSAVPGRWYALAEVVIGLWALVTLAMIPLLNRVTPALIGLTSSPYRHWFFAFAIPFVGLLPATAAMGTTFPAMERLVARLRRSGTTVAGLYATNTAGALAGVVLTTFLIAPALGYSRTLGLFATISIVCGVAVVWGPARGERERGEVEHVIIDHPSNRRLTATLFLTGLLGIGYEVLCVRVMSQVLENTVYSYASALCIYLVGTTIGAVLYQRFSKKSVFAAPLIWLFQLLCLSCLFGVLVLRDSGTIYEGWRTRLGAGVLGSVAAEMVLALLVFLMPTMIMGATFSHLAQVARHARGGVGRALGVNTLGSALAPLLLGVMVLPHLGTKWSLCAVALGYLTLIPPREIRVHRVLPTALVAIILVALPADLVLVEAPTGSRVIAYREGVMAAVAVTEDQEQQRLLKVNNRFAMGGTVHSFADRRQAHIPLLLHPSPHRVLFLGLGSGITAGAATEHEGVEPVGVELLPEVMELLPYFEPANRLDRFDAPRNLLVADARRYVRASEDRFDVIVADLFHPARDGAGALYTQEHFEAIRKRLAEGGLFCQWLPLYQLDLETIRLIVRTFVSVFPHTSGYIAHFNVETPMLGLIGSMEQRRYPADWYAQRVGDDVQLQRVLDEVALSNELTLFGCLLADDAALRDFAGDGPLNTDDQPRVMFDAPRFTYRKEAPDSGRLQALLEMWSPVAVDLFDQGETGGVLQTVRLHNYLAARDIYLSGAIAASEGRAMDAVDLYVQSAATSPDFRTAYAVCLKEALDRQIQDPDAARRILLALQSANPADPRAGQYLARLRRGDGGRSGLGK